MGIPAFETVHLGSYSIPMESGRYRGVPDMRFGNARALNSLHHGHPPIGPKKSLIWNVCLDGASECQSMQDTRPAQDSLIGKVAECKYYVMGNVYKTNVD